MEKIIITGCNGQLGRAINKELGGNDKYELINTDVFEGEGITPLDITNVDACLELARRVKPAAIINCAAYTAVDKAEDEPQLATLVNTFAPKVLAEACKRHNALLMHVSTDYVFGGDANEPYKVDDPINPQSVYGSTKADGERVIRESGCDYMIVRTAWLYSSVGKNFVKTMLMLGDTKDEINVVADQKGCPTWAHDLAVTLMALLNKNGKNEVHETFHFTNEGQITWYDFATAIMKIGGKTCKVNPITTDQYPTKARRPAYSVLDLSKIKAYAGIEIPQWRESLKRCIEELNSGLLRSSQ